MEENEVKKPYVHPSHMNTLELIEFMKSVGCPVTAFGASGASSGQSHVSLSGGGFGKVPGYDFIKSTLA